MTRPTLLAVCRATTFGPTPGRIGRTGIDKRPQTGVVPVGTLGIDGDVQADTKHHGGVDKALYAYAEHEAQAWAERLGRPVPAGLFGENLRVAGVETTAAVIGETWRIGADVVVEVTMPRTPCATFAHRMGEERWVRRFTDAGLVGAYLRVRAPGDVRAGDTIEVLDRPEHGVTVGAVFSGLGRDDAARLRRAHDDGVVDLTEPVLARVASALEG